MKPLETRVLVVSIGWPGTWGKGDTIDKAMKNAEKPKSYMVYVIHPDTSVTGMGDLSFPHDHRPKLIHTHQHKPRKKAIR